MSTYVAIPRLRSAGALLVSCVLLLAGVAMAVVAEPPEIDAGLPVLGVLAVLVPVYLAGHRYTLDFELRRNTHTVTLVQLPLALGVQFIAPLVHLAARLVAALAFVVRDRQNPVKALFNIAAACFELGAAALAVSLVSVEQGPAHWLALYAGLVVGDLVGALALALIWRLLGVSGALRGTLTGTVTTLPITLAFTGMAMVAVSAQRAETLTIVVMLALVGGLVVASRAHRRAVTQQQATERLYEFVKDLGPLELGSDRATVALEQVRVLLHCQRLELALHRDGRWSRLVVQAGGGVERRIGDLPAPVLTPTGTASLHRGAHVAADTMTAPLTGPAGQTGVLTATERRGAVRGFDLQDLRLLETVGLELSTALERGRLHADLSRAATTDALTGLPNLAETTRRLEALLADHPAGVVLASVSVDSYREVNVTLGHEVGVALLVEVTGRLLAASPEAVVGRIGGGRFAVALPAERAGQDPEMFGLALRAQVEGSAQLGVVGTHVKLSVGVVRGPDHGGDAATLLRRSETAMHGARNAHGGPVLWEPAYEVSGVRRLAVVLALREALAGGAIVMTYQPKIETTTGEVSGVEALARWTHPALGAVSPEEFIPLAETSGLMRQLTTTVLQQSLVACRSWQERHGRLGVAVNVSASSVLDPEFVTEVVELLRATGVRPDLLTLELTEGVVMSDPDLAMIRMAALRALGIRLSVDDFGTGY